MVHPRVDNCELFIETSHKMSVLPSPILIRKEGNFSLLPSSTASIKCVSPFFYIAKVKVAIIHIILPKQIVAANHHYSPDP
jgi:hypothetical protein